MSSEPVTVDLRAISSSDLARELARRSLHPAARRVLKPCRYCGLPFGVRDMRNHLYECVQNPRKRRVRKGTTANG